MDETTIAGYQIEAKLGEGGMGVVYRARDTTLDRTIAIKVIRSETFSREGRERFLREARACSRINHPNIVTVYAAGEDDGRPYMAMEFLEGRTLRSRVTDGAIPWQQALDWAIDLLDALARLHRDGIVHRDLKPENIVVTTEGVVKLMDFGIAHIAKSTALTADGTTLGTAHYMSPEQASGRRAEPPSDVFALGAVLYEMLSGQLAFQGEHPMAVLYSITNARHTPLDAHGIELPPGLSSVIDKALEKDPANRFEDAAAFRDALVAIRRPTESTGERRKGIATRWIILAGVVTIAGAALVTTVLNRSKGPGTPDRAMAEAQFAMGNELEEARRYAEAEAAYRAAIEADPTYPLAWANLGMIVLSDGRMVEADSLLRKFVQLDPGNAAALYNIGDIQLELGDSTQASVFYGLATQANPDMTPAYNNLGALLLAQGRSDEATRILRQGLDRDSTAVKYAETAPHLLRNLGKAALARGDFAQAIDRFEASLVALQTVPEPSIARIMEIHRLLAEARERAGDRAGARREWETLLKSPFPLDKADAEKSLRQLGP